MIITKPGLYPDIPEAEYHADCIPESEGGSLSVSGAKKLLPPSCPAIFEYERRNPKAPSTEMEHGTIVHAMLLGTPQPAEVLDWPNYNKKDAQEARDKARAAGRIPVLAHKYAELEAIAQAVLDDDECGGLLAEGDREVSMFTRDEEFGIWLRGRMDSYTLFGDTPTIIDVKTTSDSSPESFAKSTDKFSYFMQDAWYREMLADLLGCDWLDVDFVFVAIPTEPPYLPMAYRLEDPSAPDPWRDVRLGRELNRIAREKWRDCTAIGVWPKWSADITPLSLPGYARKRIEEGINDWHR